MATTLTRARVRELDRRAIEEYGIPSLVLMENAGRACLEELERLLGPDESGTVLCLCGAGNNGGDGLVVARTLWNRGRAAEVLVLADEARVERASEDFRTQLRLWRGLDRPVELVPDAAAVTALAGRLERAAVIVDALFGTGLDRPLSTPHVELIGLVNAAGRPVLAVDLPSGLDADTGEALGALVRADVTVTFVAEKPGLHRGEGPRACGRVAVAEIGIPGAWIREAAEGT